MGASPDPAGRRAGSKPRRPAPARPRGPARRPAAGFTLLEVLVALVIAGLALGVLFRGSLAGLRTASAAGQVETALSLAQSRLAVLGREGALVPGISRGEDNRFRWSTRVTQLAAAPPGPDRTLPRPALFTLDVTIAAAGGHSVRLYAPRLGTAPPQAP